MLADSVDYLSRAFGFRCALVAGAEKFYKRPERTYVFRPFQGIELSPQSPRESFVIDQDSGLDVSVHRSLREVCGRDENPLIVNDQALSMETRARPRRRR